jgi:acetate kinase
LSLIIHRLDYISTDAVEHRIVRREQKYREVTLITPEVKIAIKPNRPEFIYLNTT